MKQQQIKEGYATFLADGKVPFGAVRKISPHGREELVVYVENAGEFAVPLTAVNSVHSEKVILNGDLLGKDLRDAIGHAHDAEIDVGLMDPT